MLNFTNTVTSNFTMLDNDFIQTFCLTTKAKGLLGQLLSLPPTWELSISGLTKIFSDGKYAINKAFKELLNAGHILMYKGRTDSGYLSVPKYAIFEKPFDKTKREQLLSKLAAAPSHFNVYHTEKINKFTIISNEIFKNNTISMQEKGILMLLKSLPQKCKLSASVLTKFVSNGIFSIIGTLKKLEEKGMLQRQMQRGTSGQFDNTVYTVDVTGGLVGKKRKMPTRKPQAITKEVYSRHFIENNIGYEQLAAKHFTNKGQLANIVDILFETINSSAEFLRINRRSIPTKIIKKQFLTLDQKMIEDVLDAVAKTKTTVKSIKNYLLTVLYNASKTAGYFSNKGGKNSEKHTSSFNIEELEKLDMEKYMHI